ncbi:MAG: prenyltransferase [Thiotrichales bacterium]|nr:prenyltransferase [Thiotrichales bacterium]
MEQTVTPSSLPTFCWKTLIRSSRPPFLLLSMVMVLLGTALAYHQGHESAAFVFDPALLTVLLAAALLAHASVNLLNEYHDFKSGLDLLTAKTPFSGGSGALPSHPDMAKWVGLTGWLALAGTVLLGAWLIWLKGWLLLPLGIVGILLVVAYTPLITRWPWLCLIAPGLGFGPVMVLGTYYVWLGEVSWLAVLVSLIPFLLVNNLLLLNQFPDQEADKQVGRHNLLLHLGPNAAAGVFVLFYVLAFMLVTALALFSGLSLALLAALLWLPLAFKMVKIVSQHRQNTQKLAPALGMNVIINLLLPLTLALLLVIDLG